ncbi:uncharacterized protein LOC135484151 [Lineus longissimus]|uniref:uncharacterized protein LOC135484151 n=1 Tax=Lineus longissimus TaxID=88925 RepID=UPI00315CA202
MAEAAGNHWECIFVGREDELHELITAWNDGKLIFGIFGNKSIGKTRLVNELLRRLGLSDENVYRLDYSGVNTLNGMMEETKRGLHIMEDLQERTWTKRIAVELKKRVERDPHKDLVVFIKHYGDVDEITELKNEFVKLCDIVKVNNKRIRVVLTSTPKIRFAQLQTLYKSLNLWKKLSDDESKMLLRSLLRDSQVELGKYEETIIRLCEGLPHSLMIVANDLKEEDGMVEPEHIALLLQLERLNSLSPEHYAKDEQMRHVIGDVISKLSGGLGQSLAELNLLPESFDKTSGKTMLGAPNTAMLMHQYILSLTRRCILNYDSKTGRFYATGMQRESVSCQLPISEESSADVHARLEQLYQERLQKFLVLPDVVQTSLRRHAHMALHSSDVFPTFVETATETNHYCRVHLSNDCVDISEVMLAQCVRPEGAIDEGIPLSLLAKVIIEQTGDDIESLQALEHKVETLSTEDSGTGRCRELAELYQAIGNRYVFRGNKDKALVYLKKSHDLLVKHGFTEDFLFARSLNFMGFTSALCGDWLEALTYMLQSVQLRVNMLGERHIAVAIQCHNIELLFRKMKESNSDYIPFKLEKDCTSVPSKIYAMCLYGFAELFLRVNQPEKALDVAAKGIGICTKNGKKDKELMGMFHDVMANSYIRVNKFLEAESYLNAILRQQCVATPWLIRVLNRRGFVLRQLGRLQDAAQCLVEAFKHKSVIDDPMSRLYLETCQELALVYISLNELTQTVRFDRLAVNELHRLGDEHFRVGDMRQLQCIADEINQIINNALQRGLEVPFPQCCQDQHRVCFLRASNNGGMVYAEHDADELERQIIREMANEQNCPPENFASETKPCSSGITQGHSNEFSPSSERNPRHFERQERYESDFSPSRSLSGSRSSNGFPQPVVRGQHCRSVPDSSLPQECQATSHTGRQGSVDLGNHNNTPHTQVTHQSNDAERRRGTSMRGQSGFNDQTYKWCPSTNENRSDSSQNRKISSLSYPTSHGTTANESETLSPVESSWPSDSQNHSSDSSTHSSVSSDLGQFVPNGRLAQSEPHGIPSSQMGFGSIANSVGTSVFNLGQFVPDGRLAQSEPHGIPSSRMGFGSIANSAGTSQFNLGQTQADPSSSPFPCLTSDVDTCRSFSQRSCGQNLQYVSSIASQTLPKEPVSTEVAGFLCDRVNSDLQNRPTPDRCFHAIQSQTGQGFQQQMQASNHMQSPSNNIQSSPQQDSRFRPQGSSSSSSSHSCNSPISASQSGKYFIDPPYPHEQNPQRQMLHGEDNQSLYQNGLSNHQINHGGQQRTSGNSPSQPLLYYPPDTSWHPTPSQMGASSLGSYQQSLNSANTQEGYAGQFLGEYSGQFNQLALPPSDTSNPSVNSSSGPREMLYAATPVESQLHLSPPPNESQDVPFSSSASVSRKWSITGVAEAFAGFFSSSLPSRVEHI